MTKNTMTLTHDDHGTYKVFTSDLDTTRQAHSGWSLDALTEKINRLVGGFDLDYSDLDYIEALVLITYLTGGSAD